MNTNACTHIFWKCFFNSLIFYEFNGFAGSDILMDMHKSGELEKIFESLPKDV